MIKKALNNGTWVIYEEGHDYEQPQNAFTAAFDTENIVFVNGQIVSQHGMIQLLDDLDMEAKRAALSSKVWAWQLYDEYNGFFMTNSFDEMMLYISRAHYKYVWCYNAKFDFSQIDYQVLAVGADQWKPYEKGQNKRQPYAYSSLHSNMGQRYSYKLWYPYKTKKDRHTYVHSVKFYDFMNIFVGGLKSTLKALDVKDNEGNEIRKLEMDYQNVNIDDPSVDDIQYCMNDVKGLYFAVKIYNEAIEEQSNGECHIFGKDTNIMTAGGFAKKELLRSLYPAVKPFYRIKRYQKEHPITAEQDKFMRDNHLYRGGICYVNPTFLGKLTTAEQMGMKMNRYDVNSEYPFCMSVIRDLVGTGYQMKYKDWLNKKNKQDYECIMILKSVTGDVKPGYCGLWYDPFKRNYTDHVEEYGTHLMFEFEFDELSKWYDLEFNCEDVIVYKRGDYVFKKFVEESYALKQQADVDGNKGLKAACKLKLNSSYGKLSERLERVKGHYELNEENGTIHFITDGTETDAKSTMNIVIGSLVTATAHVWIMSHIREMFGTEMSDKFVYIDTDSIHGFGTMQDDRYNLGGFKLEAECTAIKYIAPKTYCDITSDNLDDIPLNEIEIHTKGVNLSAVNKDMEEQPKIDLQYIDNKINYGTKYICLTALNVKGGKVLIPVSKYLARPETDPGFINNGSYYSEV